MSEATTLHTSFCCGAQLGSQILKDIDSAFCTNLIVTAICTPSLGGLTPEFFAGFRSDILISSGLLSTDTLNQLKAEEHYVSLHSQLEHAVNMMDCRAGSDKSSGEMTLLRDIEVDSLRRQVDLVKTFLDEVLALKSGLKEQLKKRRFVLCLTRNSANFAACDKSKILRKKESLYSLFTNPHTYGRKGKKNESTTVLTQPSFRAPKLPSFVDFLQSFYCKEKIDSTEDVYNVDSGTQTNDLIDFHSIVVDYSFAHPGRNVVEEMMVFICERIIHELKHVRYNRETHLPRNSNLRDVSKDRAQFLSLTPNDALVLLLPKMPFFKEFLLPFVKNLDDSDHQPQKSLLMWTIFCCLSKLEAPHKMGYVPPGCFSFGENMLRSGEIDRINCLSNIGVSPDYTQTKSLGDEAINANTLDPDDWLKFPLEIENLPTQVQRLLEFSAQGEIIAPSDKESKVYTLKYILVHADNCDWDEKQNEVRGLKSSDCHGTLVGISIFTINFNFLQIQSMWLQQSFSIPHNIMKELNKQFKRDENGCNYMKKSDDALPPILENLADTASEYCGMSIRNEFAPSPNEKKMTSRTLRRSRDVQEITEDYHVVKYFSIYIDGALTSNEIECLPTLLKIHRGGFGKVYGRECLHTHFL